MRLLTLLAASLALTPTLFAQTTAQTSDAQWCQIIQQVLSDQGLQSDVRCDYNGLQKTLHVGVDGNFINYDVLSVRQQMQDYSSPAYIICEPLTYEFPYMRRGHEPQRRGVQAGRTWRAYTSSMPDEVYQDPRDIDALEVALQQAIGKPARLQLIDERYANQMLSQEGAQVLMLKSRVIECQRGERYEKPKEPAQGQGHHHDNERKLDRTYAYMEVHFQLIDYKTGEVLWQSTVDKNDDTFSVRYTDPMENCINRITSEVTTALNRLYPTVAPRPNVQGSIIELVEAKKEKAKMVYIDMGDAQELGKSERFRVYRTFTVAGQTGEEEIGSLQVEKIQGAGLTLCEVKKGEREIYTALQAGNQLIVRTQR